MCTEHQRPRGNLSAIAEFATCTGDKSINQSECLAGDDEPSHSCTGERDHAAELEGS